MQATTIQQVRSIASIASMDESPPPSDSTSTSPLAAALEDVGDRWSLQVVAALLDGPRRFGDLERELEGIAPNVLTSRLRQLESCGVVLAEPYSERPPRYVYELTAAGRGLAGVLRLLGDWGARNREGAESPRHDVCGTEMEASWYCPTCERPVADDEVADLRFA